MTVPDPRENFDATPDAVTPEPEGSRWGRSHHVLLMLCGAALLAWLGSGFYIVRANEVAIVERLGEFGPVVNHSGYGFPWPIDIVHTVQTQQARSVTINEFNNTVDPAVDDFKRQLLQDPDNTLSPQALNAVFNPYLITGDKNMLNARVVVNYRIDNPREYLTSVYQPEDAPGDMRDEVIRRLTARVLIRCLGGMKVDDALLEGRPALVRAVTEGLQVECEKVELGIRVTSITLDIVPPPNVEQWFSAVSQARQEKVRLKDAAETTANSRLAEAMGQRASLLASAQAYQKSIVDAAEGQKSRFEAIKAQYNNARILTTQSLYGDAMAQIMQNVSRIYLVQKGQKMSYVVPAPTRQRPDQNSGGPGGPGQQGQGPSPGQGQ